MRVLFDLSPALQRRGGMGRYAEELAKALVALDSAHDIRLLCNDPLGRKPAPPLDVLMRKEMRWPNKPWRMGVLLASLMGLRMNGLCDRADLFHATDHLLPPLKGIPTVFTLHDLAFITRPETHLRSNRWFLSLMVPLFLRRADAVICVSEHTKADAVRLYGLDTAKLRVIPEGVEERFRPVRDRGALEAVRSRYGLPERYILSVGTLEPRKNLVTLLRAFERLQAAGASETGLVIAGRRGWKAEQFLAALERSPMRQRVVVAGVVGDDDLPALYSGAELFVYPSLYEGFGLPPLEAMSCGTPVIASARSSLPEVVGAAGLLVEPEDDAGLAAAMQRVLGDEGLRRALAEKGRLRASAFTWAEAARRTVAVYEDVHQRA